MRIGRHGVISAAKLRASAVRPHGGIPAVVRRGASFRIVRLAAILAAGHRREIVRRGAILAAGRRAGIARRGVISPTGRHDAIVGRRGATSAAADQRVADHRVATVLRVATVGRRAGIMAAADRQAGIVRPGVILARGRQAVRVVRRAGISAAADRAAADRRVETVRHAGIVVRRVAKVQATVVHVRLHARSASGRKRNRGVGAGSAATAGERPSGCLPGRRRSAVGHTPPLHRDRFAQTGGFDVNAHVGG